MGVSSQTGSSSFKAIIGCSYCRTVCLLLYSVLWNFDCFVLNFGFDVLILPLMFLKVEDTIFEYPLDIFVP